MIPTIETIVEDLIAGTITRSQAVAWLNAHAEGAANELRDWFAGMALQGICANPDISADTYTRRLAPESVRQDFARSAYAAADAMILERNKPCAQ